MSESRARREEVADGVRAGYAEAQIAVKAWSGGVQRAWRPQPKGITGQALEAWVDRMAARFPGHVS